MGDFIDFVPAIEIGLTVFSILVILGYKKTLESLTDYTEINIKILFAQINRLAFRLRILEKKLKKIENRKVSKRLAFLTKKRKKK